MNSSNAMSSWCRKALQLLGGALAILLLSVPAFSQGNAGRILGTVTDQSGGVVAGATVTVIDTERGINRTLTSDDAGEYNAPNLTPGNYTVRAEAKGFKKLERQNVVLEVGKEIRIDLTVQPGTSEQTVTVTESVPLVETTNATLGGTLENTEIADLPLNGRDYQNLLALRPGVMLQVGGGPWTQSTNGVRPDQSVWLVDGVINSNFYDGRPIAGAPSPITDGATILPIDSIQEFNLMENPKAEYGWKAGAVVNVGVKSGTNQLHGSAYGFYRAAAWDARNYFDFAPAANGSCIIPGPASQCDKTPTQLKQFGGSVGGPIKKDKLFFFANYEGLRDLIGNAFGTTNGIGVPETIASALAPATANCSAAELLVNPKADCANSMVDALNNVALSGGPFNPALISATTKALTGCSTGAGPSNTACTGGFFPNNPSSGTGFLSTFPNINNTDNGVAKIDAHLNDKNTVNGDFIIGWYFGDGEDRGFNNKLFLNNYSIHTITGSGNWDYTPNSSTVNEVRFGYNRFAFLTGSDDAKIPNPVNTGATTPGLPVVIVSPFGQLGTWHNRPNTNSPNAYWDLQDGLSYLAGKHSLKFGGEYTHIEADTATPDYGRGRIDFADLLHFFAGNPKKGQFFVGNSDRHMHWANLAGFVQDDWRMSPKFTLNLGLRYEYRSPIKENHNLWANFDPTSATGLVQQGQPGHNAMWNPDRGDFSPRVGFAWDLNGKSTTVVRGGFSIIYETFTAVEFMNQNSFQNSSGVALQNNPTGAYIDNGICSAVSVTNCPTLGGNILVKAANFSGSSLAWDGPGTVFPSNTNLSCSATSKCNLMAVDPNLKTPYVMNFSLGVTHAFTNDLSLEVGYVGNHGSRLTGFNDINKCAPNTTPKTGGCVLPLSNRFPYFGFINEMTNSVRSNYNSMQVALTKRMSHGLSFIAGYTFAHGLDSGSLNRFGLLPQNPSNPGAEYGNSDFDVRHRLTLTGTYNIPGIKGFGQVLEGWQLNSILTVQSAQPWTIDDYGDDFSGTQGTGSHGQDRWDFFGNPSDFKGTQNSIPYCTGPGNGGCSVTTGISNVTQCVNGVGTGTNGACDLATSAAMWTKCMNVQAAHPESQLGGGCYISGNSVMLAPANGTYGTMGRNIFRDSGYWDLDFSVFKNFTFKERYGVQLRAEIFNILNHPIIENPYGASNGSTATNNDPSAPTGFGGAIGTPDVVAGNPVVGSGDSRALQVGLKLTF